MHLIMYPTVELKIFTTTIIIILVVFVVLIGQVQVHHGTTMTPIFATIPIIPSILLIGVLPMLLTLGGMTHFTIAALAMPCHITMDIQAHGLMDGTAIVAGL